MQKKKNKKHFFPFKADEKYHLSIFLLFLARFLIAT